MVVVVESQMPSGGDQSRPGAFALVVAVVVVVVAVAVTVAQSPRHGSDAL